MIKSAWGRIFVGMFVAWGFGLVAGSTLNPFHLDVNQTVYFTLLGGCVMYELLTMKGG